MSLVDGPAFLKYLNRAIQRDKLLLPALPDVVIRVREAVSGGDADAADIAKHIGTDVALSARLLKVVNSPLYRAREKIDNLQVAVSRVGFATVRTLVTCLGIEQVFTSRSPALKHYCREIWAHSLDVSALSRVLATRYCGLDGDHAMLSGLLHQIGKLPMLTLAETIPGLWQDQAVLKNLLDNLYPQIGKAVLEAWKFPQSLIEVAADHRNFARTGQPEPDYVDVVQVAYLGVVRGGDHPDARVPLSQVRAFAKLGIDPDVEVLDIEGMAEEMKVAQALLG
jgi:HD-like signal output (HDOD) protein